MMTQMQAMLQTMMAAQQQQPVQQQQEQAPVEQQQQQQLVQPEAPNATETSPPDQTETNEPGSQLDGEAHMAEESNQVTMTTTDQSIETPVAAVASSETPVAAVVPSETPLAETEVAQSIEVQSESTNVEPAEQVAEPEKATEIEQAVTNGNGKMHDDGEGSDMAQSDEEEDQLVEPAAKQAKREENPELNLTLDELIQKSKTKAQTTMPQNPMEMMQTMMSMMSGQIPMVCIPNWLLVFNLTSL